MCILVCVPLHAASGAPLLDNDEDWRLWSRCKNSNKELLASLSEDASAEELHKIAFDDAARHRMSKPVRAAEADLDELLCCPRFGVEQGVKQDGTKKVRAVDHFSWSRSNGQKKRRRRDVKSESINGHFTPDMAIKHDHLDDLLAAMRLQHDTTGQACTFAFARMMRHICMFVKVPELWKADVDAAFRRVPLRDSHKWAAAVAYMYHGEPWIAEHHAMPFGATASVLAWHKVGGLLALIAIVLLHLPVYRYVDDYFSADRCVNCPWHPCACVLLCFSGLVWYGVACAPLCVWLERCLGPTP